MNYQKVFRIDKIHFLTTSTYNHKAYFQDDDGKLILLLMLDCYRRQKLIKLFGFVIMPDHIHLLIGTGDKNQPGDFMRTYKSSTADRMIRYLKVKKKDINGSVIEGESGQIIKTKNRIWQTGYISKDVYTKKFLEQKLDYIHQNPCREPYSFFNHPDLYPWSSARFYLTEHPGIIPVDDVRKLFL